MLLLLLVGALSRAGLVLGSDRQTADVLWGFKTPDINNDINLLTAVAA